MPLRRKSRLTYHKYWGACGRNKRAKPRPKIIAKPEIAWIKQELLCEPTVNFYNCHICAYRTKSDYFSTLHLNRHRTSEPPFDCSDSFLPYKCYKCGYQTLLTLNFMKHVCHQKDNICKILFCDKCGFQTYSRLVLVRHTDVQCLDDARRKVFSDLKREGYLKCYDFLRQIGHNNIEWVKCKHCWFMVKMMGNLGIHTVSAHLSSRRDKWFECERCMLNIKQIFHLRAHILKVHREDIFEDLKH